MTNDINLPPLPHPYLPRGNFSDVQMQNYARTAVLADRQERDAENSPSTPAEIAVYLRDLGRRMNAIGSAMDYYGGFDGRMAARGKELVGAGVMAAGWVDEIEKETNL